MVSTEAHETMSYKVKVRACLSCTIMSYHVNGKSQPLGVKWSTDFVNTRPYLMNVTNSLAVCVRNKHLDMMHWHTIPAILNSGPVFDFGDLKLETRFFEISK